MTIQALCTIIITIGAASAVLWRWLKPVFGITRQFEMLERHTEENYNTNQILCEGMLYLLRNARTGNSVDDIKRVEDKLVVHLAKK